MKMQPKTITLKDGRTCTLRNATREDAQQMLDYLTTSAGETEFILRYPDEVTFTLEQEADILENSVNAEGTLMIVAEVDGVIAGNAGLNPMGNKYKLQHRAAFGIALMKEYWHLGIGTALTCEMISFAKKCGYEQVELEVVSENHRAKELYTRMGFVKYGERPFALKRRNGTYYSEDLMMLRF